MSWCKSLTTPLTRAHAWAQKWHIQVPIPGCNTHGLVPGNEGRKAHAPTPSWMQGVGACLLHPCMHSLCTCTSTCSLKQTLPATQPQCPAAQAKHSSATVPRGASKALQCHSALSAAQAKYSSALSAAQAKHSSATVPRSASKALQCHSALSAAQAKYSNALSAAQAKHSSATVPRSASKVLQCPERSAS